MNRNKLDENRILGKHSTPSFTTFLAVFYSTSDLYVYHSHRSTDLPDSLAISSPTKKWSDYLICLITYYNIPTLIPGDNLVTYFVISTGYSQYISSDRPADVPHYIIELVQNFGGPGIICTVIGPYHHVTILINQNQGYRRPKVRSIFLLN